MNTPDGRGHCEDFGAARGLLCRTLCAAFQELRYIRPRAATEHAFQRSESVFRELAIAEMVELWQRGFREKWLHPFVLVAALNFDFLCIHPFRDGNGRVSRLLFFARLLPLRADGGPLRQP